MRLRFHISCTNLINKKLYTIDIIRGELKYMNKKSKICIVVGVLLILSVLVTVFISETKSNIGAAPATPDAQTVWFHTTYSKNLNLTPPEKLLSIDETNQLMKNFYQVHRDLLSKNIMVSFTGRLNCSRVNRKQTVTLKSLIKNVDIEFYNNPNSDGDLNAGDVIAVKAPNFVSYSGNTNITTPVYGLYVTWSNQNFEEIIIDATTLRILEVGGGGIQTGSGHELDTLCTFWYDDIKYD